MKKIITLSIVFTLFSFAVNAQRLTAKGSFSRGNRGQITSSEKRELRQDAFRYKIGRRRAERDAVVSPIERRKLRKLKCEARRDKFKFRHNRRRRVI